MTKILKFTGNRYLIPFLFFIVFFPILLLAQSDTISGAYHNPNQNIILEGPFSNDGKDTLAENILPGNTSRINFWVSFNSEPHSVDTLVQYRLTSSSYITNWHTVYKNGEIVFHDLKAGKYIIEVKKKNNFDIATSKIITKTFIIDTVWYKKPFWLITIIIFIAIALYLFFRLYNTQLIDNKKLLEDKVLERTTALLKSNQELKDKIHQLDIITANLTATNKLKEQLISILSHDVHSPLRFSTMVGKAVLTKQHDLNKEEIIDALNDINQTGVRVLLLISNILKWIEYQKEHYIPFLLKENIRQIVQDKIEFFRFIAVSKNIDLINNVPEDIFFKTEKTAFGIIIQNLLNNAIKFTPDGEVEVNAYSTESHIIINIVDTGAGIPQESVLAIMHGDTITPLSDTENMKGNGIGWRVIKDLLFHLNGTFEIKSGQGIGTTVTLQFPV
jgi:signal transduction histidine kinase